MEIDGRAEVTAVASKAEPSADAKPLDPRIGKLSCTMKPSLQEPILCV